MAIRLSKAPSRSYEPLARRLRKGVYDLAGGKHSSGCPQQDLGAYQVKDEEMLNGDILGDPEWLVMVGGERVYSEV